MSHITKLKQLVPIVVLVFGTMPVKCEDTSAPTHGDRVKTVGHLLKVEALIAKSDAIFLGKFLDLGGPSFKELGRIRYWNLKIKVDENLKGAIQGELVFHMSLDIEHDEAPPELRKEYIFFISGKAPQRLEIIKLEDGSPERAGEVKKLVAQN